MKCKKCGTEFNSKFCPECGTPAQAQVYFNDPDGPDSLLKKARRTGSVILLCVLSCILFVLIVALAQMTANLNRQKNLDIFETEQNSNLVNQNTALQASFNNEVLTTAEYTITITDYKVIQPGQEGNEYGEKPVIAFWYDTTNNGAKSDLNASTAWILVFEAVQDNDPNVVNTLNMGMLPDDKYLDSQMQNIKVGGTISNAVAYELDDETTPVTLIATDVLGEEYGSQTFEIAQ